MSTISKSWVPKPALQTSANYDFSLIRLTDIGCNLLDPMFEGIYYNSRKHAPDLSFILQRASNFGVKRLIVTASNLEESKQALELCSKHQNLFCTAGVHPTRSSELDLPEVEREKYWSDLIQIIQKGKNSGKLVAIGECGLDYDRLHFSNKEIQNIVFPKHFELAHHFQLPMFLHDRNTAGDFLRHIENARSKFGIRGVVHSFTGSLEEMKSYVSQDLFIGINGCSLKTKENCDAIPLIPIDRLMLETDGPWCEIKNTHFSKQFVKMQFESVKPEKLDSLNEDKRLSTLVKSRCEPCQMIQVAEVVANLKQLDFYEMTQIIEQNVEEMFFGEWRNANGT